MRERLQGALPGILVHVGSTALAMRHLVGASDDLRGEKPVFLISVRNILTQPNKVYTGVYFLVAHYRARLAVGSNTRYLSTLLCPAACDASVLAVIDWSTDISAYVFEVIRRVRALKPSINRRPILIMKCPEDVLVT